MQPSKNNHNVAHAVTKIEILSFFLANPHTRDTLKGFSLRLFMDLEIVAEVMEELVGIGIVERSGKNKPVYRLKTSYANLEDYLT